MKTFTAMELYKIMEKNKYVILNDVYCNKCGHNCRIAQIAKRLRKFNPNAKTIYYSFIPCSLNEYINHKIPII